MAPDRYAEKNAPDSEYFYAEFLKLNSGTKPQNKTADSMKNSNPHAESLKPEIHCIEVLVSRNSVAKNLQWTLSIYSLENNPVTRHPAIHNCDVYHFMNFDWNRTIKQLLEDHEVPYTIVQYFSSESIHAMSERNCPFDESHFVSVLNQMEETTPSWIRHHNPDLVLHHETV